MPCSACEERRRKIAEAWHRVRGYMINGLSAAAEAEQSRQAQERNAAADRIRRQQAEMAQMARRGR
jgi:hypothetical protein